MITCMSCVNVGSEGKGGGGGWRERGGGGGVEGEGGRKGWREKVDICVLFEFIE